MNYSQRYSYKFEIPHQSLYHQIRNDLQMGVFILQEKIKLQKQIQQQRIINESIDKINQLEYRCHYYKALQEIQQNQQLDRVLSYSHISNNTRKGQIGESYKKLRTEVNQRRQDLQNRKPNRLETQFSKNAKSNKQQRKMVTLPIQPLLIKQKQKELFEEEEGFKTNRTLSKDKQKQHFQLYETPYQNLIDRNNHSKIKQDKTSWIKQETSTQKEQPNKSFIRTQYTPQPKHKRHTNYQRYSPQPQLKSLLLNSSNPNLNANLNPNPNPNPKPPLQSKMKEIHKQALKKIKNRVQVSTAIYSQSKFGNKKQEQTHLLNTFEMQNKLRSQLITKISKKYNKSKPQ